MVMIVAVGIAAMNNYEKMNLVQESIVTLSESVKRVEDKKQEEDEGEKKETEEMEMEPPVSTIQEELEEKKQEYYIVEQGDTLDIISRKIYGTTEKTKDICEMNGLTNGNLIFIGQKLLLP